MVFASIIPNRQLPRYHLPAIGDGPGTPLDGVAQRADAHFRPGGPQSS